MPDVVVIAYGRSAIARARKGSLKDMHPVDCAGTVLDAVLSKIPELSRDEISDVVVGCAKPEGVQGYNIANLIKFRAGVPDTVPAQTVNRFCASSLQAIATAANSIRAGESAAAVAGGVETMTQLPMGSDESIRNPWLCRNKPDAYIAMGLTAEHVARRFDIARKEMDEFALNSHRKAFEAQKNGWFSEQIVPLEIPGENGEFRLFFEDEGIRKNASIEQLSALEPVFLKDGRVTAGTSSQMSDGAGMLVLMDESEAVRRGFPLQARFLGYQVSGVDPRFMGIGPIDAVRKLLVRLGIRADQIDVIELNEAFAAQAIPVIRELGLDPNKVNSDGGAISLGHPLGATGAILSIKAISRLKRIRGRYALVTMCIGGGMGAAAIFERP